MWYHSRPMSTTFPITTDTSPGATGSATAATTARLHGLDWLRAIAAVAVVALHAGIAYTLQPFPGLAWPVHDPAPSPIVDALTWWIDAWIMPVFFMMGGFLAAQLSQRLGPAEFLKHRARRLLIPFAFACVVILPLDLYAWLLGWVVEDRVPLKKLRSLKLGDAGNDLWGVAHLWFLEYLFVYCAAAVVLQWVLARRRRRDFFDRPALDSRSHPLSVFRVPLSIVLALVCSTTALWWDPQLVIGFRHAWHPLPANLLYYAPCFAVGWSMLAQRFDDRRAAWTAVAALAASPLLFAAVLPLIHAHAADPLLGFRRIQLVALFAGCGWLTSLGAFRMSLRTCAPPPQAVQYLSQASFWLYLFHHPAVGLAQVAVHGSIWPAESKFAVVCLSALSLSLLTYEACVRRTWIGVLLNGRRAPRSTTTAVETVAATRQRAA